VKSKTQAQSKNLVPTNLMLDDEIRKKNQFIKLTKVKKKIAIKKIKINLIGNKNLKRMKL